jgi:alpha-L-fucosidase
VPAFGNEWHPRNMYKKEEKELAHHVATYGSQAKLGYKVFIPQFKAEKFYAFPCRRPKLPTPFQKRDKLL